MAQNQQHGWDMLLHMFPTSVIDAMARGDILQLVIFSIFFGIALAAIWREGATGAGPDGQHGAGDVQVHRLRDDLRAGRRHRGDRRDGRQKGSAFLLTLGKLVGLMYLGLVIFALIVLGSVWYLIRVPFLSFVKAIREPMLIAFTTASSEAALPKALEIMERFGVPKNIVGFVLPTGYSFNLDGRRSICRSAACSWRRWPASR